MPTLKSAVVTFPMPFGCAFGPWIMKSVGTGPYCLYYSGNFLVKDGQPTNGPGPYDPDTWNAGCNTYYGDRIWMAYHSGDGLDPAGWSDRTLLVRAGGDHQESLVGDPTVVFWNGQWHMYYEGTSYCNGGNNYICHATSPYSNGPWTKHGRVWGLTGNFVNVGYSWATTFVDNGDLYLYYTNASQQLTCAKANEPTGQFFDMMNEGRFAYPNFCARGQVLAYNGSYMLIVDDSTGHGIYMSLSQDKFNFPLGTKLFGNEVLGDASSNSVGLPTAMFVNGDLRVYFTTRPNGTDISSIGGAVIGL